MRRLKHWISLLASLILIGLVGVIPSFQPVSAGTWSAQVQAICEAKRTIGIPIVFPSLGASSSGTTFVLRCGKGKPSKHVQPGVPSTPEFCQITQQAPNGKKPTILEANNCNIDATATFIGNCQFSAGTMTGSISTKLKLISFSGAWVDDFGGNIILTGTTSKNGILLGGISYVPNSNKGQNCAPQRDKEGNGADSFKWTGIITIAGSKNK